MANSGLSVSPATGDQASNAGSSSLQPGTQSNLGNANSSNFQPSLGSDQLTSNQGISLTPKQLNTINLSTVQASSGQTKTAEPAHHFNPFLLVVAIGFFLIAIAMFAYTSRSGKDYNN